MGRGGGHGAAPARLGHPHRGERLRVASIEVANGRHELDQLVEQVGQV